MMRDMFAMLYYSKNSKEGFSISQEISEKASFLVDSLNTYIGLL